MWFFSLEYMVLDCHMRTRQPVNMTEREKRVELNIEIHGNTLVLLDIYIILNSSHNHKFIMLSCRRPNLR